MIKIITKGIIAIRNTVAHRLCSSFTAGADAIWPIGNDIIFDFVVGVGE